MTSRTPRGRQTWAAAGLALLLIASCVPHRELLGKHRAAEARWEERRPHEYRYRFSRLCECTEDYLREVWVTVAGETIVDVTFVDDQSQVPQENWEDYSTVDGLFHAIAEAARAHSYAIEVDYDAELGYPRRIYIDPNERIVDEETRWSASDLEALHVGVRR